MLTEIREIPERARACYNENRGLELPVNVPYLGMGSSHYAALSLKYLGKSITCETASDFAGYYKSESSTAVLISQSGQSSDVLWNTACFDRYVSIVNDISSPLASAGNCAKVVNMHAGVELSSATKTYVNTLITLYCGHGVNPSPAISQIEESMGRYENWGRSVAGKIGRELNAHPQKGLAIIGNGANLASAHQCALVLTESIHLPVVSMSAAQFDHGPKEAIENCIVLFINTGDPEQERSMYLRRLIDKHNGVCHLWEDFSIPYNLSPICCCIPFFFLAAHLSREMGISNAFGVGDKVTRVEN